MCISSDFTTKEDLLAALRDRIVVKREIKLRREEFFNNILTEVSELHIQIANSSLKDIYFLRADGKIFADFLGDTIEKLKTYVETVYLEQYVDDRELPENIFQDEAVSELINYIGNVEMLREAYHNAEEASKLLYYTDGIAEDDTEHGDTPPSEI